MQKACVYSPIFIAELDKIHEISFCYIKILHGAFFIDQFAVVFHPGWNNLKWGVVTECHEVLSNAKIIHEAFYKDFFIYWGLFFNFSINGGTFF